jgi:hypothetical protein
MDVRKKYNDMMKDVKRYYDKMIDNTATISTPMTLKDLEEAVASLEAYKPPPYEIEFYNQEVYDAFQEAMREKELTWVEKIGCAVAKGRRKC